MFWAGLLNLWLNCELCWASYLNENDKMPRFFNANHLKSDILEKNRLFFASFYISCLKEPLIVKFKIENNCIIQINFLRVILSWAWNELSFKLTTLSLSLTLSCASTSYPELEARAYKLPNSQNWASSTAKLKAQRSAAHSLCDSLLQKIAFVKNV